MLLKIYIIGVILLQSGVDIRGGSVLGTTCSWLYRYREPRVNLGIDIRFFVTVFSVIWLSNYVFSPILNN